jgi:hypothetical protein
VVRGTRSALKETERLSDTSVGPSMITRFATLLLATLAALGVVPQEPPPVTSTAPDRALEAELALPQNPALRSEEFVLEESDPASSAPPHAVGIVQWRRRTVDDGVALECESTFQRGLAAAGDVRVLHVERLTERAARLVWREIGSGVGRSLLVEWSEDLRALRVVEWGVDECSRTALDVEQGAVLPLYLLELARSGKATCGSYRLFDPLTRRLEAIELTTSYATRIRTVELRREDGTLAGSYRFAGAELASFQWQAGGVCARRIDHEEYARRRAELLQARQP